MEYLDSMQVPEITAEEEQEIEDAGSAVHHRIVVSHVCAMVCMMILRPVRNSVLG